MPWSYLFPFCRRHVECYFTMCEGRIQNHLFSVGLKINTPFSPRGLKNMLNQGLASLNIICLLLSSPIYVFCSVGFRTKKMVNIAIRSTYSDRMLTKACAKKQNEIVRYDRAYVCTTLFSISVFFFVSTFNVGQYRSFGEHI